MCAVKRVAVIGAGASGLTATKTCLEDDLEPVCFERRDDVGGLWYFTEKVKEGQSCVLRNTISKGSKEIHCFSDFPMPKEFPNNLRHTLLQKYLRDYVSHFHFNDRIRYNTGTDHKTGGSRSETFDAVLVCSGHHGDKNMPSFPGLELFEGPVIHSHDYRDSDSYRDKKVLVVGLGNSAGDLAVDVSWVADQVYISTRKGVWVNNSSICQGLPTDFAMNSRYKAWTGGFLPFSWRAALAAAKYHHTFDHDLYSLTPAELPGCLSPFTNDHLKGRIICGAIKIKDDIKTFTPKGVEFKDGTYEDVDVVVLATGYLFKFPFLDKRVIDVTDNTLLLYKQMFQPDLPHQTLAFIGFVQPLGAGAFWPVFELQSRVAVACLKRTVSLPSSQAMWEDIHSKHQQRLKRFPNTLRHTISVDWLPYMDDMAEMIGCKPNIGRLLLTDPRLAVRLVLGPCLPYHYRLHGPRSWPGARQAILTAMDRVRFPLQTRAVPHSKIKTLTKVARWVLFPPMSFVVFLEILVLVLLLLSLTH